MEFRLRELRATDDEDDIRKVWREDLLAVQGDKQETLLYIQRHLKSDMGNIRQNYSGERGRFFIVENNNQKLCGFIGILRKEDCFHIQRMNVLKSYRGQGLGSKLFQMVYSWATSRRGPIKAYADKNNKASNQILQKQPHKKKCIGSINEYTY